MTRDGTQTTYTYGSTDQLLTAKTGTSATLAAAWDAYGDLTSAPDPGGASSTRYAYDLAGRLTGITPSSGPAYALTLDALGRPKTRLTGGTTTDAYAYALSSDAAVSTGSASAAVDGSGSLDAESAGGSLAFTVPDLHGDVAGSLSGSLVSVADAYRYDPYGEQVAATAGASSPWRYQGRLLLGGGSAQDTYALGARAYAPALGAFTSMDTVAGSAQDPLSLNRFLYAEADPATLSDPTGHSVVLMDEAGSTLTHDRTTARTVRLASASRLRAARQAERRLAAQRAARAAWAARVDRRTGESASARADAQSAQARASLDRARTASAARVAARTGYGTDEAAAASQAAADDARESASLARTAPAGPASGGGGMDPFRVDPGVAALSALAVVGLFAAGTACVLSGVCEVAAAGVVAVDATVIAAGAVCEVACGGVADALGGSGQAAADQIANDVGPIRWTPFNGPGPLDSILTSSGDTVASTFRSSSYTQTTLSDATTLYRSWGGQAGPISHFWTAEAPAGPLQAQLDGAINPAWGNTLQGVSTIKVPAGTEVFTGVAGPQAIAGGAGQLLGGGSQYYIQSVNPAWVVK